MMTSNWSDELFLTFELLGKLRGLSVREQQKSLKRAVTRRIGPLVELAYQEYPSAISQISSFGDSPVIKSLRSALESASLLNYQLSSSIEPRTSEFIRIFQTSDEANDPRWMAFCKRLENAAAKAGLPKGFAKALTGTLEEMAFNVIDHSDKPNSAIAGYRWSQEEFEYVVSDSGIGVLESLRRNSYYSYLRTSDEALKLAVREGESRYGHDVDRGMGFRDLLNNIVNRNSYLRFRSGQHCLTVDGTGDAPIWTVEECRAAGGFLISVVSKLPKIIPP